MRLETLVQLLDDEFRVTAIPPDEPFSRILPKLYEAANIDYRVYFEPMFLLFFHGLMMKNTIEVKKVFLVVFLSEEILDIIFSGDCEDSLIFTHHPMDLESSNRGFLPLGKKYLDEIRRRRLSVYAVHTPLDIHASISTSRSIANKLDLRNCQEYDKWSTGYAGIYGHLVEPVPLSEFIDKMRALFGLEDIRYSQRFSYVHHIGIIAGGGAEVAHMKETMEVGCDTYLSGDYLNKIKTEKSLCHRREFEAVKHSLELNLIECSHFATEKIVLVNEMADYFNRLGLATEFVEQTDYWK